MIANLADFLLALAVPLNFLELLGMLTAMGLVFSGLWYGFPGPAFRYLMRRVARSKRGSCFTGTSPTVPGIRVPRTHHPSVRQVARWFDFRHLPDDQ